MAADPAWPGDAAPVDPLLALLRSCVVRVESEDGFLGTGFLIAPGEVLTCAHVVHGTDAPAVHGEGWSSSTSVTARLPNLGAGESAAAFYPLPDVALLRLDAAPDGLCCVRLGTELPAVGPPPAMLRIDAFTKGEHDAAAVGRSPASTVYEGPFEEGGNVLLKLADGQVFAGYSGAPVLDARSGNVCALVDSSRDTGSDLGGFGVPVLAFAGRLDGLLERNAAFHACDERWQRAVEQQAEQAAHLAGLRDRLPLLATQVELAHAVGSRQSDLLRPRHRVVPVVGREQFMSRLGLWREADSALEVAFLTGGGGFGKTRLAVEACIAAEHAGWTAGLLDGDAARASSDRISQLPEWPGRLFVAIDYAETRPEVVRELLRELQRRPGRAAARIVLICRQALERRELEDLFGGGDATEELGALLARAEPFRLPAEELDRHVLFHAAARAFAARLPDGAAVSTRASLGAEHYARPLFVSGAALLACQDPAVDVDELDEEQLMLELIDRHEARYWQQAADRRQLALDPDTQRSAVAIATLVGAHDERNALVLVDVVPGLADATGERKRAIAMWLSGLYGPGDLSASPAIVALDPDPLAEALIARELRARPELIATVLELQSDRQVGQALAALTRVSERRPDLISEVRAALDARLNALVERAVAARADNEDLLGALTTATLAIRPAAGAARADLDFAPYGHRFLRLARLFADLAVEYARQRVAGDRERFLPDLAMSLNNQSIRLAQAGRPAEGLASIEEAVTHYRGLAEADPERFLPDLASALNNQSNLLAGAGRPAEGLASIEEAVTHYRGLAEADPERFLPNLASALNNQSNLLAGAGRPAEGLASIEGAVQHYRRLAEADAQHFLPDLAMSLNNQSNRLGDVGRPAEGLALIEEAVTHYRRLAEADPERFLPDLAMSLNNQSNRLGDVGLPAEGLALIEEAVTLYRRLAEADPQRFLPDLAGSLNNQSIRLGEVGLPAEGLGPIEEAVRYRRELAEADPQRFLPSLASALNNQSTRLGEVGRPAEGLPLIEEAVTHHRRLAEADPQRFLPDLAGSLNNQSSLLAQAGRPAEGLPLIEEAVTHHRRLAEADPQRFLPDLAMSLNNQSNRLAQAGRPAEGLASIEEAVRYRRELAEADPQRFLPDLAGSLNNQSNRLGEAGRPAEGLASIEEAVTHYRRLAEADPQRFLPNLASALNNQSNRLGEAGRPAEGLAPIEEAVTHYRRLAEVDPQRFLPNLASALSNQSTRLGEAGRPAEGLAPIEEALAAMEGDWAVGVLLGVRARHRVRTGDARAAVHDAWQAFGLLERSGDALQRGRIRRLLRSMRSRDREGFDAAWAAAPTTGDQPIWLRHPRIDADVHRVVIAWINTPTWDASERMLAEENTALFDDRALATIEHLVDASPGDQNLTSHIALLAYARAHGVEAAYVQLHRELAHAELVRIITAWLQARSHAEITRILQEHGDVLLSVDAERLIAQIADENPDEPWVLGRIAMLTLARLDDPQSALSIDGLSTLDPEAAVGDPTERNLAYARLGVAGASPDPDAHLAHAIVAGATGREREAHYAVERLRTNTNRWEHREYARQLSSLEALHPTLADSLAAIREALTHDEHPR